MRTWLDFLRQPDCTRHLYPSPCMGFWARARTSTLVRMAQRFLIKVQLVSILLIHCCFDSAIFAGAFALTSLLANASLNALSGVISPSLPPIEHAAAVGRRVSASTLLTFLIGCIHLLAASTGAGFVLHRILAVRNPSVASALRWQYFD